MNEELDVMPNTSEGLSYVQEESTDNALKIRLAVEPIHERIEMFLSGQEYTVNESGQVIKRELSDPKANPRGVRAIMNVVMSYINPQVVQGNLSDKDIRMLMMDFRKNIASLLAWNPQLYGIKRSERQQIIDNLEPMIFMFISRTKDNKERDSYGQRTIQTGTNNYIQPKKGVFK